MIAHKFRGKLDRAAIIKEMTAAVAVAGGRGSAGGAPGEHSIGVNAEDGSRTDDGYLLEFALAARDAGASRVRYCDTTGGDSPGRIRERFAKLASAAGIPVETHCHNDLGMAVANSVSGALGDLDAGQDAWINTCVNGIGERAGNADLLSCILAFRYGFGISEVTAEGDRGRRSSGPGGSVCGRRTRSGSRCRPPGPGSAATRSRTSRASTPTGR